MFLFSSKPKALPRFAALRNSVKLQAPSSFAGTPETPLLSYLEYQIEWRLSRPSKAMEAAGQLIFDYTLKPGVVKTSNALLLMRSIGLDVDV